MRLILVRRVMAPRTILQRLQHAVDTQRIVYLPSGRYRLTDTLQLRPDTVLIGLHPSTTQLDLADNTAGF